MSSDDPLTFIARQAEMKSFSVKEDYTLSEEKRENAPAMRRTPVSVRVTSCMTYQVAQPYTVFVISVNWDEENTWTVSRRFREFAELHKRISELVSGIPALPSKKWVFNLDPAFVSERQRHLDQYISQLVTNPIVLVLDEFQTFLKMPEHGLRISPEDGSCPKIIETFRDPDFGFNDIIVDVANQKAFSIQADASMINRVDSFLLNMKLPWDKPAHVPVGCFVYWRPSKSQSFFPTVIRNFDTLATCLAYDKKDKVFVGLNDGVLKQYRVQGDEFRVESDIKLHKSKISAMYYHAPLGLLVSVSRDKTAALVDTKANIVIASQQIAESELVSIAKAHEEHRFFIGCEDGSILLVDISGERFTVIEKLVGHSASARALYFESSSRVLISGSHDHSIRIWKGGASGYKSVALITGGPSSKIKSLTFLPNVRQLISGHENGALAFWNVSKGTLVNVIQPHRGGVVKLQRNSTGETFRSVSRDGQVFLWSRMSREGADQGPVYEKKDLLTKFMKSH